MQFSSKYENGRYQELRAYSDRDKERVIVRLLGVWKACPELRLGQLLSNIAKIECGRDDLFHVEDGPLVDAAERFAKQFGKDES